MNFEQIKQKLLAHLHKQLDPEALSKALAVNEILEKATYPVGTIRVWKGKKYIKTAPGKWQRKFDSAGRGTNQAIKGIMRKINEAKTPEDLYQIVMQHQSRFRDEDGRMLPEVQQLHDLVQKKQEKMEGESKTVIANRNYTKESSYFRKQSGASTSPDGIVSQSKKKASNREKLPKFKFTPKLRAQALEAINNPIEQINYVEYTRENYDKLFPRGYCKTPIGDVKLSPNQFERLREKDNGKRIKFMGALQQCLQRPDVIIEKTDNRGRISKLYLKSFLDNNGKKAYLTVVPTLDDIDIVVSNSPRDTKDIAKEIKKADLCYYIRSVVASSAQSIGGSRMKNSYASLTSNNSRNEEVNTPDNDSIPQKKKKTSGIEAIKEKYNASQSVEGDEDEIYVGGETISGKWKLVEADAPSASHDEKTFQKTKGFPTDKAGGTINDRDYEHDKAAQEAVIDMAGSYDGRALSFDSPIVVTKDGVVISGNNRTMSSKIAARKGTDTKYREALQKRAKKFGFTAEDVAKFKNPRVVFETDSNEAYSTEQFAKFNRSGKKAMDPIESAVKVSKTIKPYTVEEVASTISEFDTLGELYADKKSCSKVFNAMIDGGLIQKTDLPAYFTDSGITGAGKEFLETVMIGSVIDGTNIRQLNTEGAKSVRQKLVRAITPLIENKGMNGYSINKELNDAVRIAIEVSKNKDKYPSVEEFSKQQDLFRKLDPVALELAKKMEGTQKGFAEFMQSMNGGLRPAANGEADIFFGGVETKEQIVNRFLGLKKSVQAILSQVYSFKSVVFHNLRGCQ